MDICIYGAGAIGGWLGARLAAQAATDGQCRVSAIARGATLASLQQRGWRLQSPDGDVCVPCRASDDPATLGPQDLVVLAIKGQSLGEVAARIGPLLGPHTLVLPAMNGVPWWFGAHAWRIADAPLDSVDPGGRVAAAVPLAQVIGCVVHASAASPEPGLVLHRMGRGLILGEPGGGVSERVQTLAALLGRAGITATVSADVRKDIWFKLWGNLTINPITAITGATTDRVLDDPLLRAYCSAAMREASAVGVRIGCAIDQDPEDRHAITRRLGAFKPSMLQDAEAGRPLELDAIVSAVHEIGQRVGVATPHIDALLGMARLFGRVRGLYPLAPAG